jgi:hypothetical protein
MDNVLCEHICEGHVIQKHFIKSLETKPLAESNHIATCCDGPCPKCLQTIKPGKTKVHLMTCHGMTADSAATLMLDTGKIVAPFPRI